MAAKKMNEGEMLEKKAELKASAEEKCLKYNEALLEEKIKEAADLGEEIAEICGEYADIAQAIAFKKCAAAPDPMLYAVTVLTYEVIAAKDNKVEGSDIPRKSIEFKDRAIDLGKLHKAISGGIGADKKWIYKAEKFNCLLTAQAAKDLGIDPKAINDSYAMAEIARDIDLGKTPTSKTNILKTLRGIIAAMIGEEFAKKVTSHDVNFLLMVYAKKSRKALTVTTANHKYLRGFLAEICHRVVLDKIYAVEYKKNNK